MAAHKHSAINVLDPFGNNIFCYPVNYFIAME